MLLADRKKLITAGKEQSKVVSRNENKKPQTWGTKWNKYIRALEGKEEA